MPETSEAQNGKLRSFILLVFFGGWIAAIVAFALFMREWVPDRELEAELAAAEEADTEAAADDIALASTLRPLTGPLPTLAATGSVYVPVYKSVYVGDERSIAQLSATISVRNTSAEQPLVVASIAYFNRNGATLPGPMNTPHVLGPMATAEVYVDIAGTEGGPVAAVVVDWGAEAPIPPPIVNAVIVGSYGAKAVSFVVRGESLPDPR